MVDFTEQGDFDLVFETLKGLYDLASGKFPQEDEIISINMKMRKCIYGILKWCMDSFSFSF